jgi:hypothetical protein
MEPVDELDIARLEAEFALSRERKNDAYLLSRILFKLLMISTAMAEGTLLS